MNSSALRATSVRQIAGPNMHSALRLEGKAAVSIGESAGE